MPIRCRLPGPVHHLPRFALILLLFSAQKLPGRIAPGQTGPDEFGATGLLTGTVSDRATAQPLAGANIIIEGTELGAATDVHGRYMVRRVPVGSYTVRVEMIGYGTQSRSSVHLVSRRETVLNLALEMQAIQGREVTVSGRFFERARDAVVSARTVDIEEIRSDPAGSYDIQRMMEALPSVVLGADQHNELIVRGGDVGENLFVMDHLEIPNPNHFGEPGTSGGAVNMINTDFIERIDFYAGAFPARYGERLSSVMDLTLREGNRSRFQSHLEASLGGFGAVIEGPLRGGRGSFLGSYRKSFLDLIIRDVGLTAVPHYANWQAKVVFDLGATNKLLFNLLGGSDDIDLEGSTVPQTRGIANVLADNEQLTYGLTLKSLLSTNGYGLLSLSRSETTQRYNLYNVLPPDGRRREVIDLRDTSSEIMLKGDLNQRLNRTLEAAVGFNHKWCAYNRNSVIADDTLWTYRYGIEGEMPLRYVDSETYYSRILGNPDSISVRDTTWLAVIPGVRVDSLYTTTRTSFYGQVKWRPGVRWQLILGLRHYRVAANGSSDWGPRLGLTYALTDRTRLNLAFGRHYQAPKYFQLFSQKGVPRNMSTSQAVVGVEYLFAEDTRGTLEIYHKTYENLVLETAETTPDTFDVFGGYLNAGNGYARGLELFLQKKFTRGWYGSFGYSYSVSRADDPRPGFDGTIPRRYDYRHLLTAIGGYKHKFMETPAYQALKRKAWWPWVAWLPVLPADEVELSFRYRMVGGRPYTPRTYSPLVRHWYQPADTRLNSMRLESYLRFDIMILRRFYLRRVSLVTFVDIQNLFDRDNPWDMVYYLDGTSEIALQYKQFPVGGVILEF